MKLNKDSLEAVSVLMPLVKQTNIVLVGCGGTGSWLAPHLARMYRILEDGLEHNVNMLFWDPDCVEQKNIFRQNFCEAEIGANKAETLATRYNEAWGINIVAVPKEVDFHVFGNLSTWQTRSIVITCVDNNDARQVIAGYCKNNHGTWWMDTGNLKTAGQVSVGIERSKNSQILGDRTTWLPLPTLQFPQIMESGPKINVKVDYSEMSCAEMALLDDQGFAINQLIASQAAAMLASLLLTDDLRYHCAYVNTTGTQVIYNTPRLLKRYFKQKSPKGL